MAEILVEMEKIINIFKCKISHNLVLRDKQSSYPFVIGLHFNSQSSTKFTNRSCFITSFSSLIFLFPNRVVVSHIRNRKSYNYFLDC